ncbi:MAG: gliding motility-associated C-terminal domain-containing protein [Tannerellaceae bacterium]|nr:gliding motility-associated C-terminal domain-containing protein [Tannerellaceae bacterium]
MMRPLLACMLLFTYTLHAQYSVTGGRGTPHEVVDDTANKLKVYLVYGIEQVELAYTSSSTSHKWFRYKTSALEAEAVASTQTGTQSVVDRPEEGYGYFVEEAGRLSQYIWIIDYSKYAVEMQDFYVEKSDNACTELWFNGKIVMEPMYYWVPATGIRRELEREFELTYNTLEWSEEEKHFSSNTHTERIGNPLKHILSPPPLADTDFRLTGDLFARHFEVEQSITTPFFETVAIETHADTTMVSSYGTNMVSDGEKLSAPVTIRFNGYANSPVASLYIWKIWNNDQPDDLLIRYTGEEVTYTFERGGTYTALLEVSDRTGACVDSTKTFEIKITESMLEVPNVFSPGVSPGINDEFKVAYKSIVTFKGWIFNRWGVEMFRWTDPSQGWDGKKGGKYVPPGVYFYVIEAKGADGESYLKKGDINIIRSKRIQDAIIEE